MCWIASISRLPPLGQVQCSELYARSLLAWKHSRSTCDAGRISTLDRTNDLGASDKVIMTVKTPRCRDTRPRCCISEYTSLSSLLTCVDNAWLRQVRRNPSTYLQGSARASPHQVLGTALCDMICNRPPVGRRRFGGAVYVYTCNAFGASWDDSGIQVRKRAEQAGVTPRCEDTGVSNHSQWGPVDAPGRLNGSCVEVLQKT